MAHLQSSGDQGSMYNLSLGERGRTGGGERHAGCVCVWRRHRRSGTIYVAASLCMSSVKLRDLSCQREAPRSAARYSSTGGSSRPSPRSLADTPRRPPPLGGLADVPSRPDAPCAAGEVGALSILQVLGVQLEDGAARRLIGQRKCTVSSKRETSAASRSCCHEMRGVGHKPGERGRWEMGDGDGRRGSRAHLRPVRCGNEHGRRVRFEAVKPPSSTWDR